MDTLFLKIVNMSIAASWLILAVILLRLALKKAPKWIICVLWALVAVRLVCPVSLESRFCVIPYQEPITEEIVDTILPEVSLTIPGNQEKNDWQETEKTPENVHVHAAYTRNGVEVGTGIWALGVVLLLSGAGVSYLRLRRKIRPSLHLRDNIWLCDEIATPFLLGVLCPTIYIPSGTEEHLFPYIIAHENAHLQRRDHFWKPLGFMILAVHWFNPLVWAAYILLCRDIEFACDEKTIKILGKEGSIAYSEALLTCSVNRKIIMVCPLAFGEISVKERVRHVLNYKKPAFWVILAAVLAGAVLAACFLTRPYDAADQKTVITAVSVTGVSGHTDADGQYMLTIILDDWYKTDWGLENCEFTIRTSKALYEEAVTDAKVSGVSLKVMVPNENHDMDIRAILKENLVECCEIIDISKHDQSGLSSD